MRRLLDHIRARAAARRRRAGLQRALEPSLAVADPSPFDEFGAPEGGFGRIHPLRLDALGLDPLRLDPVGVDPVAATAGPMPRHPATSASG